jgi:hypothetical protein
MRSVRVEYILNKVLCQSFKEIYFQDMNEILTVLEMTCLLLTGTYIEIRHDLFILKKLY